MLKMLLKGHTDADAAAKTDEVVYISEVDEFFDNWVENDDDDGWSGLGEYAGQWEENLIEPLFEDSDGYAVMHNDDTGLLVI